MTPEQVNGWLEKGSVSEIAEELRKINIHVPLGHARWVQWQEKIALETTLWQFIESLIAHDHHGDKKWNGQSDLKEWKKKIRHIRFPEPE